MTIKECIDIVDNIKPNQYTVKDKVMWLSFIDEIIINEVLKTHEGYDGRYDDFEGYSEDKLSVPLIVPSPYDRLYTAYLKMKIDSENGETARYNNSVALYNTYMLEYRKYYNKTHLPLNATNKRAEMPFKNNTIGLSDAEFESLKRDVIAALDDIIYSNTSPDKIYDIVTKYVSNNVEMLKGKDGDTPKKGIDYYTEEEKRNLIEKISDTVIIDITPKLNTKADKSTTLSGYRIADAYTKTEVDAKHKEIQKSTNDALYVAQHAKDIASVTNGLAAEVKDNLVIIKSDVEGLQKQINEEAHFRGYLSTNAKIQSMEATPNDFAYSAESGTVWVYDAEQGWQETNTPVPDKSIPASNTTPLINGEASAGTENAYARGDHRHPTDTTRASVTALNTKADKPTIKIIDAIAFGLDFLLNNNHIIRCGTLHAMGFNFSNGEYPEDYGLDLSFDSGASPTTISYSASGIINWVGVDCSTVDGLSIFQPSPNTHYDIVFYYNGNQFIGLVNGYVPASGNVVSE